MGDGSRWTDDPTTTVSIQASFRRGHILTHDFPTVHPPWDLFDVKDGRTRKVCRTLLIND